eukprot:scaffold204193_cov14-Tisochrysis_lutea.AAC.1
MQAVHDPQGKGITFRVLTFLTLLRLSRLEFYALLMVRACDSTDDVHLQHCHVSHGEGPKQSPLPPSVHHLFTIS